MGIFNENLIVEFPGGKVESAWYDWIGLAVIESIILSKSIKKLDAKLSGVRIETKN